MKEDVLWTAVNVKTANATVNVANLLKEKQQENFNATPAVLLFIQCYTDNIYNTTGKTMHKLGGASETFSADYVSNEEVISMINSFRNNLFT